MTARAVAGSILFALLQLVATPVWAVVSLLTFPFSAMTRYRVVTAWSRLMIWGAERLCGIRYRVTGAERLPQGPCIVLSKHESAWETLAFQVILPPQVWVLKRSLLWIPFFGWGLAMLSPIAIDRKAGPRALRDMLEQGRDRLARGFWIVIFPEGTRTAPGARGDYQIGGAWLAAKTGAPVVPVAHNAGSFWPRNSFIKRPGLITVSIGPAVHATGGKAAALMQNIASWIDEETERLHRDEQNR